MCAALLTTGFTSCLDTENERFVEPGPMITNDSAFHLLSVLNGVRTLGSRQVLLGELRADLMATTPYAATELRQIDEWTLDQNRSNRYLSKREYYKVINECNYIIQYGAALPREQAVAITMRAWTYLQLALNYGSAAYYEDFIDTDAAAYEDYPKYTVNELADRLIPQLEAIRDVAQPDYGSLGTNLDYQMFNTRFVLADLYLWRGNGTSDYVNAANLYYSLIVEDYPNSSGLPHLAGLPMDFSSGTGASTSLGNQRLVYLNSRMSPMGWANMAWNRASAGSTFSTTMNNTNINYNDEVISDIRYFSGETAVTSNLDTLAGINVVSTSNLSAADQLEEISLTATRAMSSIFSSTPYLFYENEQDFVTANENTAFTNYLNPSSLTSNTYTRLGDLRLNATYTPNPQSNVVIGGESNMYPDSVVAKYLRSGAGSYDNKIVSIYRTGLLYLRYAEAVNRAGQPGLAMIALKYGLNRYNVRFYMPASEKLSVDGENMSFAAYFRNVTAGTNFSVTNRTPVMLYNNEGNVVGSFVYNTTESRPIVSLPLSVADGYLRSTGASGYCFPIYCQTNAEGQTQWFIDNAGAERDSAIYCFKDTTETYYNFPNSMDFNVGLHWRGAGCAALDTTYRMPNVKYPGDLAAQQAYMDSVICNEYALETAHEGGRFYDLMRLSKHRQDPHFLLYYLGRKYDSTVITKLSSGSTQGWDNSAWYLPDYQEQH